MPLHLGTLTLSCTTSLSALALWNNGSLPWRDSLKSAAEHLADDLKNVNPEAFQSAVAAAAQRRLGRFVDGVLRYRQLEYRRDVPDPPVIWQQDAARLLDYRTGPTTGETILVVPSLVNRAFILDLSAERSLLRHLASSGIAPLLLDWGAPGEVERRFSLTDYIAGPLEAALDQAAEIAGGKVVLAGYCMGGLLALAAALRRPDKISRLVLLATPWDFHIDPDLTRRLKAMGPLFRSWTQGLGEIPVDLIQTMLYGLDPTLVLRKFDGFSRFPDDPRRLATFAALEDWLNDGIPLAGPVAEECLLGWYGANSPATLRWRVAGRVVDPAEVSMPCLVVVPSQDRIVPPESALSLARALPNAEIWTPPLGHIGMITSHSAVEQVWHPLTAWLGGAAATKP